MASNNYNANPYISFNVPPPNYNSANTGMKSGWNQGWKSHQPSNNFQSSTRAPKVNINSHKLLSERSVSHGNSENTTNSSSNVKKYPVVNTMKNKQIKTNDGLSSYLSSGSMAPPPPPPPPPPFIAKSTQNSMSNTATNYYMANAQSAYQTNRYNTSSMPYLSPPLSYSTVSGDMYATSLASYYTPPPAVKNHTSHPPPHPSYHYPNPIHHGYMRNNYYKHKGDSNSDLHRNYYKRRSDVDIEAQRKANKKRKKPLSQNIPQRKDWSVDEAKKAIEIEKEYNKRNKSQSLIIKFPDTELNRDIVSGFHPAVDNVHFQQPSTPRFCFVTLKDGNNPDEVIDQLNKTPFGHGYLTAEYKKDREDEMNIGPEDIDPLTLYVGNLAQDVIKEDMVKIYPKHKRVDIGYAKKMKYTRYAFVSFKAVDDAIEAFKQTHATQLYSKSLIVRFRRLHGTVGMPGEPKPQVPSRSESYSHLEESIDSNSQAEDSELAPWEMVDVANWRSLSHSIKRELTDSCSEDEMEDKKPTPYNFDVPDSNFVLPEPINIKKEDIDEDWTGNICKSEITEHEIPVEHKIQISHQPFTSKVEPPDPEEIGTDVKKTVVPDLNNVKEESKEKKISTYKQLFILHNSLNNSAKKASDVTVKKEILDSYLEDTANSAVEKDSVNSFFSALGTTTIAAAPTTTAAVTTTVAAGPTTSAVAATTTTVAGITTTDKCNKNIFNFEAKESNKTTIKIAAVAAADKFEKKLLNFEAQKNNVTVKTATTAAAAAAVAATTAAATATTTTATTTTDKFEKNMLNFEAKENNTTIKTTDIADIPATPDKFEENILNFGEMEVGTRIKTELYDDDISNDGDGDNSSEDELDFNNILSKIEQKKSKMKKFSDRFI